MIFTFQVDERILNGFCRKNNYLDVVNDGAGNFIPNPQSMEDFFQITISNYIFSNVQDYEIVTSAQSAKEALVEYVSRTPTAIAIAIDSSQVLGASNALAQQ